MLITKVQCTNSEVDFLTNGKIYDLFEPVKSDSQNIKIILHGDKESGTYVTLKMNDLNFNFKPVINESTIPEVGDLMRLNSNNLKFNPCEFFVRKVKSFNSRYLTFEDSIVLNESEKSNLISDWVCLTTEEIRNMKPNQMRIFKEGDYVVTLNVSCANHTANHCYKIRKSGTDALWSRKDNAGQTDNGSYKYKSYGENWRYATPAEITMYEYLNRPFDVTRMDSYLPKWVKLASSLPNMGYGGAKFGEVYSTSDAEIAQKLFSLSWLTVLIQNKHLYEKFTAATEDEYLAFKETTEIKVIPFKSGNVVKRRDSYNPTIKGMREIVVIGKDYMEFTTGEITKAHDFNKWKKVSYTELVTWVKAKYPVGTTFKDVTKGRTFKVSGHATRHYSSYVKSDTVYLPVERVEGEKNYTARITSNGKWAEIVKTPAVISESSKKLLINYAEKYYPIGTECIPFNLDMMSNSGNSVKISNTDYHVHGFNGHESVWVSCGRWNGVIYTNGEWAKKVNIKNVETKSDKSDIFEESKSKILEESKIIFSKGVKFKPFNWSYIKNTKEPEFTEVVDINNHRVSTMEGKPAIWVTCKTSNGRNYGGVVYFNGTWAEIEKPKSKYKAGDLVIVKSWRQCNEGNGIGIDNLVSKLYDVNDNKNATGMLKHESDFQVECQGRFFNIKESHIIGFAEEKEEFKIGDLIVSKINKLPWRKNGDIFQVHKITADIERLYYEDGVNGDSKTFRKATTEECINYNAKTKISEGDWVVFMPELAIGTGCYTGCWSKPYILKVNKIVNAGLNDQNLHFTGYDMTRAGYTCISGASNSKKFFRKAMDSEIPTHITTPEVVEKLKTTIKPPIGLRPENNWKAVALYPLYVERLKEIKEAIDRYEKEDLYPPIEWLREHNDITELLNKANYKF